MVLEYPEVHSSIDSSKTGSHTRCLGLVAQVLPSQDVALILTSKHLPCCSVAVKWLLYTQLLGFVEMAKEYSVPGLPHMESPQLTSAEKLSEAPFLLI